MHSLSSHVFLFNGLIAWNPKPLMWDEKCNRAVKAATMILNLTAGDNGGSLTV